MASSMVSVARANKLYAVQHSSKRVETNRNVRPKGRTAAGIHPTESPKNESVSSPKSVAGFLLLDPDLRPVSFNAEAVQILSYPEDAENAADFRLFLENKIRSILVTEASLAELSFLGEFRSGRRRYFCRAFAIDSVAKGPSQPTIAVVLDRGPSGWVSLPQVARHLNLTQREREVLEYLLQGMSNKEIADRMKLRANTVKSFLRCIMIKTGTSSRSMIVARLIMSTPAREAATL